jgi:hypothetical protein
MEHDTPDTPLLPPDLIYNSSDISCDGSSRSTRFKDMTKARQEYNKLRKEKLSLHRKRKYVFGATYENIFTGYFEVDPLVSDYDLIVTLDKRQDSVVRIRLVAPFDGVGKTNLLSSIVELGRSLSGPGNARGCRVGDLGAMHAIGLKSATSKEIYKTSENTNKKVAVASAVMREWLEDHMREDLGEIVQTDTNSQIEKPLSMPKGPGSRMMVSVNLANAPHYDSGDTARSIAVWVEERPGLAQNWYFVLPNVSHKGSKGVIIRLVHGVVISWDGREIFHCSSRAKQGDSNKTYGCMWSSSRK